MMDSLYKENEELIFFIPFDQFSDAAPHNTTNSQTDYFGYGVI